MSSGAPVENGQTIRQPSVALLCVDSDDQQKFNAEGFRIDSETPSRIYINKQRPLMFGYMTRLALSEMNIQWDTPNVNKSNNTLTMALYSATDATPPVVTFQDYIRITITEGFYSPDELATEIANELNADPDVVANGLTFTVTYDNDQCNFSIVQTAIYPSNRLKGFFQIISGSAPRSLTGLDKLSDDILYCIGMDAVDRDSKGGLVSYYSRIVGGLAPMLYTPYIDVVSNLLTKNQNVSDGSTSTVYTGSKLARIYFSNEAIETRHNNLVSGGDIVSVCNIVGTRPCIFRREFKVPKQIQWNSTENVDAIDIQVLDYKGNPVVIQDQITTTANALTNGISVFESSNTSFQFTLQISES